jgi:transcriptional regulator with XRE-family HTH domain
MSQTEFAQRLDVSRSTLALYEAGRSTPDALLLAKAIEALQLDAMYVLVGKKSASARASAAALFSATILPNMIKVLRIRLEGMGIHLDNAQEADLLRDVYYSMLTTAVPMDAPELHPRKPTES